MKYYYYYCYYNYYVGVKFHFEKFNNSIVDNWMKIVICVTRMKSHKRKKKMKETKEKKVLDFRTDKIHGTNEKK